MDRAVELMRGVYKQPANSQMLYLNEVAGSAAMVNWCSGICRLARALTVPDLQDIFPGCQQ
jgi:hypothetical protein